MIDEKALEAAAWEGVRSMFEHRHGAGACPDSRLANLMSANEFGETWEEYLVASRAAITAYLAALEARGYVIVPREPTNAMLVDGSASLRNFYSEEGPYPRTKAVYRAMIAARDAK